MLIILGFLDSLSVSSLFHVFPLYPDRLILLSYFLYIEWVSLTSSAAHRLECAFLKQLNKSHSKHEQQDVEQQPS